LVSIVVLAAVVLLRWTEVAAGLVGTAEIAITARSARITSATLRAKISPLSGWARAVLRDVEAERAPTDLASMELLNRLLRVLFSVEPNEREASGPSRLAVLGNVNVNDLADLSENLTELFVRRGKVEVPYEYLA
jgi:hypothetical protein